MLMFCMFLPAAPLLLLPVLLPGIVHGFLLVTEGSVGSAHATRTVMHSTVTAATASAATASHAHQPLAIHGDWQAFFDEDRYCLMYYFNTKTGESQWEPPPDFPIPKLDSHASSPLTAPAAAATTQQSSPYFFFATADDDEKPQYHQQHSHQHYHYDAASAASSTTTDVGQTTAAPHTATTTPTTQQQSDVAAVVFKAALGFAATLAGKAVEAVTDHVKKQQQIQQQQQQQLVVQENNNNAKYKVQTKKEEDKPWWLSFFYQEKQNKHQEPEEPIPIRSRSEHVMDLLSEIDNKLNSSPRKRTPSSSSGMHHFHRQQQQQQPPLSANNINNNNNNNHIIVQNQTTAKKQQHQMTFWPSWNTVNNKSNTNTAVDEPTKPLVPPRRREQWLQEKLYADSLKRQENLRKSYRRVIENRSPTISLSALKRDHKKDWHQYLNDEV